MNRRIRAIFFLMTACIVAINAFQAYWLLVTYRLNRSNFKSTVKEALFQVVEVQQITRANALFGDHDRKPGIPGTPPGPRMIVRKFQSGPNTTTRFYLHSQTAPDSPVPQDTLANRISKKLILGWAEGGQIDKRKLFSAYRDELRKRGVDGDFLLDTLHIPPQSDGENRVYQNPPNARFDFSKQFKTFPVPVNPVRNLFVQATFDTPFLYLLKKMGSLLAASFLLLILTTGCFIYMLRTILRQKRLAEVKNDFINNMTHELKTPIATVHAAVEAMLHFGALDDRDKTQKYLSISQTNLARLSDLVEKVLSLAVDDRQEMKLLRERVNLAEMIRELADNHRLKAKKQVDFQLQIQPDAAVSIDKVHFGNVINNLIDNAINYSYDAVTIMLRFNEIPGGWQLVVADNGIGIEKNYQDAIFDRFFRVPTGDIHAVKGFGLGLAYVRQVVERHGGKISISSEPGKGSEFILTF